MAARFLLCIRSHVGIYLFPLHQKGEIRPFLAQMGLICIQHQVGLYIGGAAGGYFHEKGRPAFFPAGCFFRLGRVLCGQLLLARFLPPGGAKLIYQGFYIQLSLSPFGLLGNNDLRLSIEPHSNHSSWVIPSGS